MENFNYLEKLFLNFEEISVPVGTLDPGYHASEKFFIFRIPAGILFILKTVKDRAVSRKVITLWVLLTWINASPVKNFLFSEFQLRC